MSPSRLFRTLVCRAPLVIGTAVVVASIVLLASFGTPTSYDAHALARLGPLPADATAGARAPSSPERAQALASDRVLRAVTDELRLTADPSVRALRERRGDTAIPLDLWMVGWLRQSLTIEATEGSPMVRVGFRAHDPVLAARIANALVTAPPAPAMAATPATSPAAAELRRRLAEAADRRAPPPPEAPPAPRPPAQLEADLAASDPAAGATTNRQRAASDPARTKAISNHRDQLAGLQQTLDEAQRALESLSRPVAAPRSTDPRSGLTVVAAAAPASSGAHADLAARIAAGIGAGLLAGIVVALVIERARRPVRDAADLVRAAGLPVLGSLCDAADTRRLPSTNATAPGMPDPPVLTRIVSQSGRRGLGGDPGAARA
jgi:uncharacterized protein involved in exopolysaccharide biosynthesis